MGAAAGGAAYQQDESWNEADDREEGKHKLDHLKEANRARRHDAIHHARINGTRKGSGEKATEGHERCMRSQTEINPPEGVRCRRCRIP